MIPYIKKAWPEFKAQKDTFSSPWLEGCLTAGTPPTASRDPSGTAEPVVAPGIPLASCTISKMRCGVARLLPI